MTKNIFLPLAPSCLDVAMNTLLETPMANPTNTVLNVRFETKNLCSCKHCVWTWFSSHVAVTYYWYLLSSKLLFISFRLEDKFFLHVVFRHPNINILSSTIPLILRIMGFNKLKTFVLFQFWLTNRRQHFLINFMHTASNIEN